MWIKLKNIMLSKIIKTRQALAGAPQLAGASSPSQKVAGSVPGQGTWLGFGFDPWCRHIQEATWGNQLMLLSCISVSLSLFLSPFLSSLKAMKKKCPQVKIKKVKIKMNARHKMSYIAWFCLYEMSRQIHRDREWVVIAGDKWILENDYLMGTGLYFKLMKMF